MAVEGIRGRSHELSTLRDAFHAACEGRAGAVLVGGDAGVGKTRLVGELAGRPGSAVPWSSPATPSTSPTPRRSGRCCPRSATRAPEPDDEVAALLRQWLDTPAARRARRRVRPCVLLDLLHQRSSNSPSGARCSLVIEDLQWADRSTRDLVAYLVANLVHEPVLVVATLPHRQPAPARRTSTSRSPSCAALRKVTALDLQPLPRERGGGAGRGLGARTGRISRQPGLAALGGQRVHRRGDGPGRASAGTPTACRARCARSC